MQRFGAAQETYLSLEFVENKAYWYAYIVHFHVDRTKAMLMLTAWEFFASI